MHLSDCDSASLLAEAPPLDPAIPTIEQSLTAVCRWIESRDYKGYDPADGNASVLHPLCFGNVFLQRVLQQVVLRSPFNIRPWLGVPPLESAPARGYMAAGYVRLYSETGDQSFRSRAESCLDWLIQNKSPGYSHYSWGNQFNYATRTGKRPRLEPIIVWSSLNGQAFVDAAEVFHRDDYMKVAQSICEWICALPREETSSGSCLSYVAYKQVSIHNSNMLGAALLARVGAITGQSRFLDLARDAMLYSCSRLRPDGSWWYGEHPKYQWIDNFHTGYNLECLKIYRDVTGDRQFDPQLTSGLAYFKQNFFEPDGCPKYYHNAKFPVDIQSASEAIDALVTLADLDPECLPLAIKIALWSINEMQDEDGHFYYRDLGWTKVKTPMIHWGQATMFKALVCLFAKLREKSATK
jgi:rhamnogalacturonyl hydrolase YesR